jgi:hypothetical protein
VLVGVDSAGLGEVFQNVCLHLFHLAAPDFSSRYLFTPPLSLRPLSVLFAFLMLTITLTERC